MRNRTLINLLVSAVLVLSVQAPPAQAQMPVIDGTNLVQTTLQATRALEQIHNQIQQIEQQARMLATNPLQLSPQLSQSIGEARQLFNTARGLAFEVNRISSDIQALYPDTWQNMNLGDIGQRTQQWLQQDRASLEVAMRAEAQAAAAIETQQGRIEQALSSSAGAQGQTGAVQASNQLLGINASQLAQIQALLVAQSRALTTERLERVAQQQRALEVQRRAFPGQYGQTLTPARTAF